MNYCSISLILNRKQKEALVIRLTEEGKSTREIAKTVKISLKDIGEIIRSVTGDANPSIKRKEEIERKELIEKLKNSSSYAKAFQMFRERRALSEIVVALDLKADVVMHYYSEYLCLVNMKRLVGIYNELNGDLGFFLYFYRRLKDEDLDDENIDELIRSIKQLSTVRTLLIQSRKELEILTMKKKTLETQIMQLKNKANNYDGTESSIL